ncbi:glycosyltransferase family 4 protein [Rhodonellum sp.]|uniref:glycosyltransferase family 4 protein n=1 Tax=Rhodonellum sp. TaxID=2231180 RepID=UPI00271791D2|nr:glycosyltransferase [Rhodonellum sp.]MDO9551556.1 glycosyltransferase [Rhodonellum sp.]
MKKVLFVHDGPLRIDNDNNYYGVQAGDAQRQRYLSLGDSITYIMRLKVISDSEINKYSLIKNENFSFIEIPNFLSILKLSYKRNAIKIIKDGVDNHDIIVARLPSAAGAIAVAYAKSINKPILIELVACVYDALWNYDWRGKLLANYKLKKYQAILKDASHVIYVTTEFLQKRYPTKGKSIGCSDVVLKDIDTTVLKKRLLKIENIQEPLVLGTVAAIDVPYKGQADVINVIAKSNKKTLIYKIVGQGNSNKLQNLVDQNQLQSEVQILGSLSHDQVFGFIDDIDLYIQPSKQEGLPRAVIEAMSRACPVVGSNIAGIPELINEAALFEAGNLDDIKNVLTQIDKNILSQWAVENFKKAVEFKRETLDGKRKQFYEQFKHDFNL